MNTIGAESIWGVQLFVSDDMAMLTVADERKDIVIGVPLVLPRHEGLDLSQEWVTVRTKVPPSAEDARAEQKSVVITRTLRTKHVMGVERVTLEEEA